MRKYVELVVVLGTLGAGMSCTSLDPTSSFEDDRLHLAMVLEPGREAQFLLVRNMGEGPLPALSAVLVGPDSTEAGQPVELRDCVGSFGTIAAVEDIVCIRFAQSVQEASTYLLTIGGQGKRTVTGQTTVPASPAVDDVEVMPDSVYVRYSIGALSSTVVTVVHHAQGAPCPVGRRCSEYAVRAAAALAVGVPVPGIGDWPSEAWWLESFHVDEKLSRHLATGNGGGLFSIEPVSTVTDGLGVFGSWSRLDTPGSVALGR